LKPFDATDHVGGVLDFPFRQSTDGISIYNYHQ